jgi:membrane protein
MLVAGGGVMIVALLFVSVVKIAEATWFGATLAQFAWIRALQAAAFASSATILPILALSLVYYFLPNAKIRFRDVWVGAFFTGVLWRIAFEGFSRYIGSSGQLTLVHGSIAAVIVFLLWIYMSSVILMYGVEFTAAHARLRRGRSDQAPGAEAPRP